MFRCLLILESEIVKTSFVSAPLRGKIQKRKIQKHHRKCSLLLTSALVLQNSYISQRYCNLFLSVQKIRPWWISQDRLYAFSASSFSRFFEHSQLRESWWPSPTKGSQQQPWDTLVPYEQLWNTSPSLPWHSCSIRMLTTIPTAGTHPTALVLLVQQHWAAWREK